MQSFENQNKENYNSTKGIDDKIE